MSEATTNKAAEPRESHIPIFILSVSPSSKAIVQRKHGQKEPNTTMLPMLPAIHDLKAASRRAIKETAANPRPRITLPHPANAVELRNHD